MTRFLLLLSAGLLAGCAAKTQSGPTAIGTRDFSGARTGDYRVVGGTGSIWAQGRFVHGKMDGKWLFFDSHQIKVAEFTYRTGAASGPYRTFFGSTLIPAAAGKLESEGRFQDGRVTGRHVGYDAAGKVFTDAMVEAGKAKRITAGTPEQAVQTAESDEWLLQAMENAIRPALH